MIIIILRHQERSPDGVSQHLSLYGYSTPFTNRYLEKAEDYHDQGYSTSLTDIDREMCADNYGALPEIQHFGKCAETAIDATAAAAELTGKQEKHWRKSKQAKQWRCSTLKVPLESSCLAECAGAATKASKGIVGGAAVFLGRHRRKRRYKKQKRGSSTPFTYRDPEMCADNHDQGIWQKLRSHTVPLLYVIVGAATLVIVIILAALLSVRGDTPERKVVNGSTDVQCMDDWILYRGKCYYFSDKIDTWTDSQNFCNLNNSSLAIIDNEKELNFLNLLKSNYWIGLSRTQDDSGWVWTNGTFYSETLFNIYRKPTVPGESENVFLSGHGFRSESGRYLKKYICRKSFLGHPP